MRPFRILFVDDSFNTSLSYDLKRAVKSARSSEPAWILRQLKDIKAVEDRPLHLYWAADLLFEQPSNPGSGSVRWFDGTVPWSNSFLQELDVLVLDFGGIKINADDEFAVEENQNPFGLNARDCAYFNEHYPGAVYYIRNREALKNTQKVIFYTRYNPIPDANADPLISKYIGPLCDGKAEPYTVFKTPDAEGNKSIVDEIRHSYESYVRGFTRLENEYAIRFAASHDLPVLIVGETGTGKEGIAHNIHRAWIDAKKDANKNLDHPIDFNEEMYVVNCAGLSRQLARGELFGYVKGSYTGADGHYIGGILKACGCKANRSRRKSAGNEKEVNRQYQLLKELSENLEKYEQLQESERPSYWFGTLRAAVYKAVVPAPPGIDDKSAYSFFKNLHNLYKDASQGADNASDFERVLLGQNEGKIIEKNGSLVFKDEGPFGTLFLDEFAELHPEVQTLLLRFLESKEIQPLGYPGVIKGANVRLIVATSNPGIGDFVNKDLKWSWRREHEQQYSPMREDLVFRVKGQVIQAEPVDPDNALDIVEHLIKHSKKPGNWPREAKEHLAGIIIRHLKEIERIANKHEHGNNRLPTFGHKREIKRVIDLANAYVSAAPKMGVLRSPNIVDAELIDMVWAPSFVRSYGLISDEWNDAKDEEKFSSRTDKERNLLQLENRLQEFFEDEGLTLPKVPVERQSFIEKWLWKSWPVWTSAKPENVENLIALTKYVTKIDKLAHPRIFGIGYDTVRNWGSSKATWRKKMSDRKSVES